MAMGYEGTMSFLRFFRHLTSRYHLASTPSSTVLSPRFGPALNTPGRSPHRCLHVSAVFDAPPPKKSTGAFKAGMTVTKKRFDVETDPHKLVNYLCGGQYLKEGPEVKLKPDSEYPDWLWTLRTDGRVPLDEMDPDTVEYWERVKELQQMEYKRQLKAVKGKHWLIRMAQRKKKREEIQLRFNRKLPGLTISVN